MFGIVMSLVAACFARPRLALWSGRVTLAALLLIGIFPIGKILLHPLEAEFSPRAFPAQIDGIVVLGGVEDQQATAAWRDPLFNEAAERADEAGLDLHLSVKRADRLPRSVCENLLRFWDSLLFAPAAFAIARK